MHIPPAFLPVEILEECFRPLSRQDICNVIFVCRFYADVGRLLLYRSIVLRSDQRHVKHTISLLRRAPNIAVKISHAILTTVPPFHTSPWIPPDLFRHSVNLNSLELRGFPFPHPEDQHLFHGSLEEKCKSLTSFTYRPGAVKFPESGFKLKGLKCFTWQSSLATTEVMLTPIVAASTESLTSISFEGMVVHKADQPYGHFLRLHFPHLECLELGSLIQTNTPNQTNICMTKFILAHERIERLSLGKQRNNDMFFQFAESLLQPDSLPHLTAFEGFPENVAALTRREVASLSHITALSLFCWAQTGFAEVHEMIGLVKSATNTPRRLLQLTDLRLHFDVQLDHMMPSNVTLMGPLNLMNEFADICPVVARWHGRLPPMHADNFRRTFEPHEHLEQIALPSQSFIFVPSAARDYFAPVAAKCRKLARVVACKPLYTDLEDTIYTLVRNERNELEDVHVQTKRDISAADIHAFFPPRCLPPL